MTHVTKGASINFSREGTKNLGKIYPVNLAIPPIKRVRDFAIPPPFSRGEIS